MGLGGVATSDAGPLSLCIAGNAAPPAQADIRVILGRVKLLPRPQLPRAPPAARQSPSGMPGQHGNREGKRGGGPGGVVGCVWE